jgi:hypothetical protein
VRFTNVELCAQTKAHFTPHHPTRLTQPPLDAASSHAALAEHRVIISRYLGSGALLEAALASAASASAAAADAEERRRARERDEFAAREAAAARARAGMAAGAAAGLGVGAPPDPGAARWECNKCLKPNAFSNAACFFCRVGARPRVCACTYHNFHQGPSCGVCGSPLPPAAAAAAAGGGAHAAAAAPPPMKQQRMDGAAAAGAGAPRNWKCGSCFEAGNDALSPYCKFCKAARAQVEVR